VYRTAFIQKGWFVGPSVCGVALLVAIGLAISPVATMAVLIPVLGFACGLVVASRLRRIWLVSLAILLIGYAFLGKGFAYVGVPPLFVGEAVLALGMLAIAVGNGVGMTLRSPLAWLWVAFALDGLLCTAPYVGIFGMSAVRDAAAWGYGLFALLAAGSLARSAWLSRIPAWYGRMLPWLLYWLPAAILIQQLAGRAIPRVPGSGMPLLNLKSGDTAVHLAGASSFLLLGLHLQVTDRRSSAARKEWILWLVWLVGVALTGSASRAGLLSIVAASVVVLWLRPSSVSKLGKVTMIVTTILVVSFAFNIQFNIGAKSGRTIGPDQIIANIRSAFGGESEGDEEALQGTRSWRLKWWGDIVNYTILGNHFWTGKGYGINLADDDGFQGTAWEGKLRNPHSVHLMILARSGVPGLALWLALQLGFAIGLTRAYLRARHLKQEWWALVNLWILAYWTAFLVNASFDVYLEGPQGGIWFWSLMGFGIALVEYQRRAFPRLRPGTAPNIKIQDGRMFAARTAGVPTSRAATTFLALKHGGHRNSVRVTQLGVRSSSAEEVNGGASGGAAK
jgi:O-antigen ligase